MTIFDSDHAPRAALVAGGRGFVGAQVARALIGAGWRPTVFGPAMAQDRLADLAGRYDEVAGSIEDRDALARAFERARPEAVVSCVAHGVGALGLMRSGEAQRDAAFAVNALGHDRLLEAAGAAGVRRVVWTSSTVVYGPASLYGGRRVDEDAATAPTTVYGLTKQLAEAISAYHARRCGLDVVGLRLPLILGPGLWYQGAASALADLFAAARANAPARVAFHDQPFDLMHVADVADAVLRALDHRGPLDPVYNLKAVEARLSEIVAEIARRRPQARLAIDVAAPALLFPLIDGARFSAATGFHARHDLPRLVAALLEPGDAP